MYPDLTVITGYSQGLGKELAISMQDKKIWGISRTKNNEIDAYYTEEDISHYEETYIDLVLSANKLYSKNVGIVLCAGTLGEQGGLLNSSLVDWEQTFKTNVLGNLAVLQAFLPHMVETGFGRVVFLSGGGAATKYPIFSGYALSKVAVVREVENIAEEMKNIKDFSIIALAPGAMETSMLKKVRESGAEVKTTVDIQETVKFIQNFLQMNQEKAKSLSGKFIHVRDNLNSDYEKKWLLRRLE